LRSFWTKTSLVDSKMIPPHWKRNPTKTNLISPNVAMTTPRTMKETLKSTPRLGWAMPMAQPTRRTATGVVAFHILVIKALREQTVDSNLEHLNKCNAEIYIC
jgi:hypothetical protein